MHFSDIKKIPVILRIEQDGKTVYIANKDTVLKAVGIKIGEGIDFDLLGLDREGQAGKKDERAGSNRESEY